MRSDLARAVSPKVPDGCGEREGEVSNSPSGVWEIIQVRFLQLSPFEGCAGLALMPSYLL
jgi:hypothetical protein